MPLELTPINWTLSKWLAVQTNSARNSIVKCIEAHQPTHTDRACSVLLNTHLRFYEVVAPVYHDTNLRHLFFTFMTERELALFESQRGGETTIDFEGSLVTKRVPGGLMQRIGWLYATEFVDRGLTRLLAETRPSFAGLNVNSEASTALWMRFRNQLDSLDFSDTDEERVARSANTALLSYSNLFDMAFKSEDT